MPKFCKQCGTQLNDTAKFCPKCGTPSPMMPAQPLQAAPMPAPKPKPKPVPQPQVQPKPVPKNEPIILDETDDDMLIFDETDDEPVKPQPAPQVQPQPAPQVQPQPAPQVQPQPVPQVQPNAKPDNAADKNDETNKKPKKKKSKAWIIVLIVFLLLAAAAAVVLIFFNPFKGGNAAGNEKSWVTSVPNVVSSSYEDAADTLNESSLHGLIYDKVENDSTDTDKVLTQNPEAEKVVNKGSIVDLVVSAGKEKTYLPDITGYTFEYANKLLTDAGFKVKQEEKENDNFAPESVGEQSVKSGYVDKGQEITVKVTPKKSATAEDVKVPNITGMDIDAARAELKKVGLYLAVNVAQYSDTVKANQIISQNKPADSAAKKGETVLITVSLGKKTVYVPDVKFRTQETAEKMLKELGVNVRVETEESRTVAKGTVISQTVETGKAVEVGTEVTIKVSSGYEITVPKVKGKTEAEAISKLVEEGLSVSVEYKQTDDKDKYGKVTKQSIKADEKAELGTEVVITVGAKEDYSPASDGEDETPSENGEKPQEAKFDPNFKTYGLPVLEDDNYWVPVSISDMFERKTNLTWSDNSVTITGIDYVTTYTFDDAGRITVEEYKNDIISYTRKFTYSKTEVKSLITIDNGVPITLVYPLDSNGNPTGHLAPNYSDSLYEKYDWFYLPSISDVEVKYNSDNRISYYSESASTKCEYKDISYATNENTFVISATPFQQRWKKMEFTLDGKGRFSNIKAISDDGVEAAYTFAETSDGYSSCLAEISDYDGSTVNKENIEWVKGTKAQEKFGLTLLSSLSIYAIPDMVYVDSPIW